MIRCKHLLLFGLLLAGSFAAAAQPAPTAITNVRIFDGTRVIPRETVVFQGNRIAAVGEDVLPPQGAQVIDGTGMTLLPGFIDGHTHTWGEALERALVFGVTTELDMFTAPPFARQDA